MWETIKVILSGSNAWCVILFFIFVFTVLSLFAKNGYISIKTKNLQFGNSEIERTIIRNQTDWAYLYIMALEPKIDVDKQFNFYITRYILERVYDEVVEWITFNHISTNKAYVQIKQEKICALVYGIGVNPILQSKEFTERMYNWTEELITRLLQIREYYEGKK